MSKLLHPALGDVGISKYRPSYALSVLQHCRAIPLLFLLFATMSAYGQTDLALTKSSSATIASIGQQVSFTVSVINQSTSAAATNVVVSDPVPANTSYVSSSGVGTYNNTTGLWTVGSVATGDTASITITLLISGEGVIYNLAEVMSLTGTDTDSQPNNSSYTEDDIASACVSVPIWLACDNTAGVTLSAPTGHNNYQWFRDGQVITGAQSQTYVALLPGDYTFTTSLQPLGCPAGNCCPVIVRKYACLGDLVWVDTNGNGQQDMGEPGLVGVSVQLTNAGPDGIKGTNDDTPAGSMVTGPNGTYLFSDLAPGTYFVTFGAPPAGYTPTTLNNGNDVTDSDAGAMGMTGVYTLAPGQTNTTVDAGFLPPASLGNLVWFDTNQNGLQDMGEAGVDSITVTLFNLGSNGIKDSDDIVVGTAITSGGGLYLFNNLVPGSYYVMFSDLPTNHVFTLQNQGGNDAIDSDVDGTGMGSITVLDPGESDLTHDAGIYLPLASLGDFVWNDTNQNGIQDNGELGVENVTVELFDLGPDGIKGNDDVLIATLQTDADGYYVFTDLEPGSYFVMFSDLPTNFVFTTQNAGGDDALDSDVNGSGMGSVTNLDPGEDDFTHDAGIYLVPQTYFDLALIKRLSTGQEQVVTIGDEVSFTFEVRNQGLESAYNVQISDYIPAGFVFDPLLNSGWTSAAGVASTTLAGPIAPATSMLASLTLTVSPTFAGNLLVNGAELSFADNDTSTTNPLPNDIDSDSDTNPGNDTFGGNNVVNNDNGDEDDHDLDTVYVEVFDLTLTKSLVPGQTNLIPGDSVTYQFAINNQGNVAAMNIKLSDYLPANLILADADWSQATPGIASYTYTGTILPGGTVTIPITFIIDPAFTGGIINNVGEITEAEDTDGNIRDDIDSTPNDNPNDDPNNEDDFGMVPLPVALPVAIGNQVWYDNNGNGLQDPLETGVPNVTVTLLTPGPDGIKGNTDDVTVTSMVTNAQGQYLFNGLNPGAYYVMFTGLPSNYTVTTQNVGANDAIDSDANAMGMTDTIQLFSMEVDSTIDLGITPNPASLGNFVWFDTNNNGIQDPSELGVPNVSVTLLTAGPNNIKGDADDVVVTSTTTNASGSYGFSGLAPGTYYVMFGLITLPPGYAPTTANVGSNDAEDSDVNAMGMTDLVTLAPGQNNPTLDMGIVLVPCSITIAQPDEFLCEDDFTPISITFSEAINTYSIIATSGYDNVVVSGNTITFNAYLEGVIDNFSVTLQGVNGASCQATDVFTLNRISAPDANFIVEEPACSNDTVCVKFTGTASPGAILNWNVADGTIVYSSPATATEPAGAYTCVLFPSPGARMLMLMVDDGGCEDVHTQGVNVKKAPTANAGLDQTICRGQSATLNGTTVGGLNCWWEPNTPLSNNVPDCDTIVSPLATTDYVYWVCDANNCKDSDTVRVNVIIVTPTIAGVSPICLGSCSTLTASGGSTYVWSTGATGTTINPCPTANTTYTVTATSAQGCTGTATFTVVVNPLPVVAIAGPTAICAGASATLTASGAVNYVWSTTATTAAITVSPIATTTYTVTATDANACTSTSSITITVNPLPAANAGPDQTICAGQCASLTASGGGTYAWNTGATTATISPCPTVTTTYTVTVTSAAGCTATDQVVVNVNSSNPNAGPDQTVCAGSAVMLQASGGGTYAWSNGVNTAMQVVKPTSTTTYTVTVTSPNGCTGTDQVTIFVNPTPNVQVPGATVCPGQCVDLTATGAVSYTWYPNDCLNQATGATVKACPTATKTWIVTGVDANGCIDTAHVTVVVQPLIANAGPDVTICTGQSTTLTAGPAGGTYAWSNGGNTASISVSPSATTTYTVTVTNAAGCTGTDQVVVTIAPNPVATITGSLSPCPGTSTTLTASGGGTYRWSNGSTTASITVSAAGTYTVTVTNAAGCTDTESVIVTPNSTVIASINPNDDIAVCPGSSIMLMASATGGTPSYTFAWSPASGLNTVSGPMVLASPSATTTYVVTATDANGCTDTEDIVITVKPTGTANAGADRTICAGASATLTATGGGLYLWNTGASTASISVTPAVSTTYTVTVTSPDGCTATDQVLVNVAAQPIAAISGNTAPCTGGSTTLVATGGGTYNWSNGANTASITVGAGTYTVTVTNAAGCTDTESITVTPSSTVVVTINPSDLAVCPGSSIMLMANATGGQPSYTYAWSPASTLNTATGPMTLASPTATTTYIVTATDANGCTDTEDIVITVKAGANANAGADQTICGGSATLIATGAGTFSWSNGGTSAQTIVSPAVTTTYTVTVTSADGCTATDQVVVNIGGNTMANAGADQTLCAGGSVTLTASGANTYAWSNGANTASITVSPSATTTYTVTATNAAGCTDTDEVIVTVAPSQFGTITNDLTACAGLGATLTATGGGTYAWSNGATGSTITVIPAATTTYTVTITNASGCTAVHDVLVTVVTPSANAGPDRSTCAGTSVTLTAAAGGVLYAWSNGTLGATTTVSPSTTTTYTVTVSAGGGCTATDQVVVTVNPNLAVTGSTTNASCAANNGSITASVTGGAPATFAWSNGASGATVSNLAAGTYTVTATSNASSCTGTATFTVGGAAGPDITLTAGTANCAGANGTITVGISNGTSPYTVSWSGAASGSQPASGSTHNINNLVAGAYTVTVSDANGCTDWANVTVNALTPITASTAVTNANCCGQNGALSINVQGAGTGTLSYAWSPNVSTSASASALNAGTYNVTVTSSNGCTTVASATIIPDCSGCQDIVPFDTVTVTQADTVDVCFPGWSQSQLEYYDILVNGTAFNGPYHGCDYDTLAIYNYAPLSATGSGPYQLNSWTCNGGTFSAPSFGSITQLVDSMRVWDPTGNWNVNTANNNIYGGVLNSGVYGSMNFTNLSNWTTATLNTNYGSVARGTAILIPGTPGKHVVVLVDPATCCRDTVCVIVNPGTPPSPCTNFVAQTTASAVAPTCSSNGSVCLDVPLDILITHNIQVNGAAYTAGFQGCNFDTAFAYLYATVPSAGASGPYTLNSWTVNGTPYNGTFSTIAQLVTLMNGWDPQGDWTLNPATLTIRGGITSKVYGAMSITQNATGGTANLQPNLSLAPMGMQLSLPVGVHQVMYIDKVNGCRDSVLVTITCPPPPTPCNSFIAQTTLTLPSANCANYFQQFCIEIPFQQLSNYNVKQNGQFYTGTTSACNFNGQGAGTGTSFAVTSGGTHTFIFTNAVTGCADTLVVNAPCFTLSPQYLTATIYVGDIDTVCLDVTELPGNVFTVLNSCPSTNEFVIFDRVQGTVCYLCTGIEVGVENVCFVLCDDQGNCDSTFMTVNVLERDQSPAIGVADMDTTITNTRIVLDVLANDTVPTALTGFNITRQPLHGTVTKSADNKLVYQPFNNFCDSNTPDNFEYVVCNPITCDTVTVYVWVLCDKIRIFTGFSPNNDMINDFFVIEGIHNFPNNELKIFNRWGNQVYRKAKYDNTWDGTWNNEPIPDGTYFYIFNDGEGNDYSGYIQIMR